MMAGEISAVGTLYPQAAATALGLQAAAAGTQFVSEAAQIAARRQLEKLFSRGL